MRRSLLVQLGPLVVLLTACAGEVTPLDPAEVLQLTDSVVLAESDSLFLGRAGPMVVGPAGHLFLVDLPEQHIKEIDGSGQIVRVFGRRGRGPGEFASPHQLALAGDTLLVAWDHGQRHFAVFDLRSGGPRPSIAWGGSTWPPNLRVIDNQIVATRLDLENRTSLVRLAPSGTLLGQEGIAPEVAIRNPLLLGTPMVALVFAEVGGEVFAAFELSPFIHRWHRGERMAAEITVPAVRRRGVRTELFEEMLRNPDNIANLMYARSVPFLLEAVAPNILALVTFDGEWTGRDVASTFFVSLVDVAGSRTCVDLPVPTARLPFPALALSGDTLIVVQQTVDPQSNDVTTIRRFRIDVERCPWTASPS